MTVLLACEQCLTRPATHRESYHEQLLCGVCGCECGACRQCCEFNTTIPYDWRDRNPSAPTVEVHA